MVSILWCGLRPLSFARETPSYCSSQRNRVQAQQVARQIQV
jgi:hypothetical protein